MNIVLNYYNKLKYGSDFIWTPCSYICFIIHFLHRLNKSAILWNPMSFLPPNGCIEHSTCLEMHNLYFGKGDQILIVPLSEEFYSWWLLFFTFRLHNHPGLVQQPRIKKVMGLVQARL